jgi:carboxypeptidase Taq
VLRFELELELFEGQLEPAGLPAAWNERTNELFGLAVPDDADGVLQDVHWAAGLFGYFPTYSLGNIVAGQLWAVAVDELNGLDDELAAGELTGLRDFLRERVHRHGSKYEPEELIERAVGSPLDTAPLLRQLNERYGEIYSL